VHHGYTRVAQNDYVTSDIAAAFWLAFDLHYVFAAEGSALSLRRNLLPSSKHAEVRYRLLCGWLFHGPNERMHCGKKRKDIETCCEESGKATWEQEKY